MPRRLGRALRWLAVPLLLAAAGQLAWPAVALARGGGGGHGGGGGGFGGGGGGFGGGGGGGFGGGGGGFGGGVVGGGVATGGGGFGFLGLLILIVVVILVLRYAGRFSGAPPSDAPRPVLDARPTGPDPALVAGVAAIKSADPDFEPETFLQRAEMAYLLVQRAYQDRNVHAARAFLATPLWERWSQGVQELADRRQRPVLENLNVRGLQVLSAEHGAGGDVIGVHFDVVAAPHLVDEQTGQMVSGTAEDQRLGEDWTFQRLAGARTVVSGGATASKCPSCGGLLKLNDDGRCDYCRADIASGRYDWVVGAITSSYFTGAASAAAAFGAVQLDPERGIQAIREGDPSFDEQAFLGRVQQAFYALEQAWQDRDLLSGRLFMSPGLYLGWSAQVRQLLDLHKKNVLEGLRLDRLDVVKVIHGGALDDVTVRVDATCADYEVDERNGQLVFGSRQPAPFTEYWTFQRSRGTQTTGRSTLDKVCPNCGAPLEINQVGECRYCKAAVTSGRFDWVLSRIEQAEDYAG